MMTSDFIVDVDESSFEYEVLSYSKNVPVVVEFWATWCRPCKVLGPMLEAMAKEANGAFRLARIDTDQNPNLALQFGVRTIPTVKAITGGQVVGEFAGVIPEERLREFLEKITPPSPMQLLAEKAAGLFSMHQYVESERIYRQLLEQTPDQPACLLGLSKALMAQNKAGEALQILRNFPASRLYSTVELLMPYAQDLVDLSRNTLPEDDEADAAYRTAIRLASRGNFPAALDGLLDILRINKTYRRGRARQVVIALLELMGEDDPQTREYRGELASVLF